jgi:hypothetical protein
MDQAFHLNLYNCTFARDEFEGYSRAVYITGNSFYNITTELIVKNCLFTGYNYGMECNLNVNIDQNSVITDNGIDRSASDLLGPNLIQKITASNTVTGNPDIGFHYDIVHGVVRQELDDLIFTRYIEFEEGIVL